VIALRLENNIGLENVVPVTCKEPALVYVVPVLMDSEYVDVNPVILVSKVPESAFKNKFVESFKKCGSSIQLCFSP
jgi:hypothetical protein